MYLSKSDYLLFKQCQKSFWLQKKNPELFGQEKNENRMDKGNEVTELARKLFPNGTLIPFSKDPLLMVEITKRLIEQEVQTIYEAAFIDNGLLVICDVLTRDEDGWKVYEVKSSTEVKERYQDDVAYQWHVIKETIPLQSISVTYLNKKYVRQGELDIQQLFTHSVQTEYATGQTIQVAEDVLKMKEIVEKKELEMDVGLYCNKYGKDDFPCAVKEHCWSHIPKYSVFNLSRIGKKAFDLYYSGIVSIEDIPDNYKLSDAQKFQVKSLKEEINIVEKESIKEFLKTFIFPLYFLDFETYQQMIPLFDGIKPYQQVPFQYSLHIMKSLEEELIHKEFLAKEGTDPRRILAERLVSDIPKGVWTVAFNMAFEKMVLRELAEQFPDLAEHLMDIHDHMIDLMIPFQKKWYFTPEMKGKYSIKYVLPALYPNEETLNYQNLNIQNGGMAMETYERLHTYPIEEIEAIRQDLLAYCKLDTYAMVKVFVYLYRLIENAY